MCGGSVETQFSTRDDVTIFRDGRVRLPNWMFKNASEVMIEIGKPRTIRFRPAKEGELGVILQSNAKTHSKQASALRALARLGIKSRNCFGRYMPRIEEGKLCIELVIKEGTQ